MERKAVLVGINYPGTDSELKGCVNDVMTMKDILIKHYKFDSSNINMLTDAQATTSNIKQALEKMVSNCQPGDSLFFHYSGHGSQLYNGKFEGDIEKDGLDEILCPIDLDWGEKVIRDDDLKKIFDKVPNGVQFTIVLDCCHSGDGIDHDEAYQPLVENREITPLSNEHSNRYLQPPAEMLERASANNILMVPHDITNRDINKTGVLISGCRSNQTSADAFISGRYMGACTHHLAAILKDNNYCISYLALIDELNKRLARAGFEQRPELDGPKSMYGLPFIACDKIVQNDHLDTASSVKLPGSEKPNAFEKIIQFVITMLTSLFK